MAGPSAVTPPVIWYTVDGGQNWSSSAALDVGQGGSFYVPGVLQFIDMLHGFLLLHTGVGMNQDDVFIFSTQDGGKTWKRVVDPYMETLNMACTKTGMDFADANTGLVTGDCVGVVPNSIYLYRTTDGGSTWNPIRLPIPAKLPDMYSNESNSCGSYIPGFSGQTAWVVVRCNDYDPAVAKTFLYLSTDAGKTWSSHSELAAVDFVQFLNPGVGWYAGGGQVFLTENGGQIWQPVSGLPVKANQTLSTRPPAGWWPRPAFRSPWSKPPTAAPPGLN